MSAFVADDTPMTDAAAPSAAASHTAAAPAKKRKRIDDSHEDNTAHTQVSTPTVAVPLLGGKHAADTIKSGLLSASNPTEFIEKFQHEHAIAGGTSETSRSAVQAGLEFLDLFTPASSSFNQQQQGRRGAIYAQMIHDMVGNLSKQVEAGSLSQERQLTLLEASFPYLRIDELAPIPLALLLALTRAHALPVRFLKALCSTTSSSSSSSSSSLESTLPLELRRAMMELDPEQQFWRAEQMQGFIRAYTEDRSRIDAYLNLYPIEQVAKTLKSVRAPLPSTSIYSTGRSTSAASSVSPSGRALQSILDWIGPQPRLYRFFCSRLRDHVLAIEQQQGGEGGAREWRCLRVDLLMRLHDTESAPPSSYPGETSSLSSSNDARLSAASVDVLHTWAWCLDSMSRKSDDDFDTTLLDRLLGRPDTEGVPPADDEESQPPMEQGFLPTLHVKKDTLHDLGLLTAHVFTLSSLCRSLLSCLAQVIETEGATPRGHANLPRLVKVAHLGMMSSGELAKASLAAAASSKLGLHLPSPPHFDSLLDTFFPALGEMMLLAQLGESEDVGEKIVNEAGRSKVARGVVMQYVCTRVQAQDVAQVQSFLSVLPKLTNEQGENVWREADRLGEQQLLHSQLHTLCSLLHSHLLSSSKTSTPAFRSVVFPHCLILLAQQSAFAHAEALKLLVLCERALSVEEVRAYARQLKEGGRRSSGDQTKDETTMTDVSNAASAGSAAASSPLTAQIDTLYEQLKTARPQAFD
jgi:hypothetical protein